MNIILMRRQQLNYFYIDEVLIIHIYYQNSCNIILQNCYFFRIQMRNAFFLSHWKIPTLLCWMKSFNYHRLGAVATKHVLTFNKYWFNLIQMYSRFLMHLLHNTWRRGKMFQKRTPKNHLVVHELNIRQPYE